MLIQSTKNYHEMDSQGKKNLVATYMEKGGIKNLEWVPSYFESSETLNTDLVEAEKGYYTAAKVLSFQGFVVGQNLAPDRSSAVLQALLEENWQANGLDKNDPELAQENSACPELKKYFYIHSVQKDIAASTHKTSLHQSADLKHQGLKAVLDKKGSDGPAVKLENPGFTELKARQTVQQSGKSKTEKDRAESREGPPRRAGAEERQEHLRRCLEGGQQAL